MDTIIKNISKELDEYKKNPRADRRLTYDKITEHQSTLTKAISESTDKKIINKLEHLLVRCILTRSEVARKLSMPDFSFELSELALTLAIKLNDQKSRAEALYDKAIHYNYLSDYNLSKEYLEQTLEVFKSIDDVDGIARCYMGLGNTENSKGNMKKSLMHFNKAISLLDDNNPSHKLTLAMTNINIANSYQRLGKSSNAIAHLEKAKKIFLEIGQVNSIQILYNNLGYIYFEKGEIEKALNNFKIAIEKSEQIGDDYIMGSALGNLGLVYKHFGEYDKSLECFFENIKLKEKFGDLTGLSTGYMNIGIVYKQMQHQKEAVRYFKKALKIKNEISDANGKTECLVNLAYASETAKDFEATEKYTLKALKLAESTENLRIVAYCYNLLSRVYAHGKDYKKAFEYVKSAIKISKDIQLEILEIENKLLLSKLYMDTKEYSKAEKLLKQTLAVSERQMNISVKADLFNMFADLYERTKNYKKAYEYSLKHIKAKEKVFNESSDKNIKQLKILFDIERAEKEKELYRVKNVELKRALEELSELHEELIKRENQKSEFLSIASHDLRNPLSAIIGLSNYIIEDDTIPRTELEDYMKDIITSSNSMLSIVRNFLNLDAIESKKFQIIPEKFNLTVLLDFCITKFINDIKSKGLTLHKNYSHDTIIVNYDKSLVLQIFDNLISNAVKFSYSGKNVYISLIMKNRKVIFFVKDEGPGLTAEDKTKIFDRFSRLSAKPTAGEHSLGLGLSIVNKLTTLIKAKVNVYSIPGEGAEFSVELKSVSK